MRILKMQYFLNKRSAPKGTKHTHTSMAGGSYNIPQADMDEFYRLYAAEIKHKRYPYLTERHNAVGGPCVMDFDFRYEVPKGTVFKRLIDKKVIEQIANFIDGQIKDLLGFRHNRTCVILQRPTPYVKKELTDTSIWSDGLHIQFPFICCGYDVQHLIRKRFIEKFQFDPDVSGVETIDKIYDKAVIQSNNWCMYGSTKQGLPPYVITHICGEPRSNEIDWKALQASKNIEDKIRLVKLLSIQSGANLILPLNPELFVEEQTQKLTQKAQRNPILIQKLCQRQTVPADLIQSYLDLLADHRADLYNKWIRIGMILHNCADSSNPHGFLDMWIAWSKRSDRYEEGICQEKWNTFNSEARIGFGSLIYYAKKDSKTDEQRRALFELRIKTYIHNYKQNFNLSTYEIESVQLNPTKTRCQIALNSPNCPFAHKIKSKSNRICLDVTDKSLQINCETCGCVRSVRLSVKACQNIFGLNVADPTDFKLSDLEHTSDILCTLESAYLFDHKIKTTSKYIKYDDRMKQTDTLIYHSPTGTGKTTILNHIIKDMDKPTILSVVSRQTMAAMHSSSLKSFALRSYLDKQNKSTQTDRFILSLEQLHKIERTTYDVLVLDEINSLLMHLYSPTMDNTRQPSFDKLVDLVRNCKKLVVCDAHVTDMVLEFVMELRSDTSTLFYRNLFKNRLNIPMNIYFRQNNTTCKELQLFCKPMIKSVKNKESMMIVGDSRETLINIHKYLAAYADPSYFLIYTRDIGDVADFENCNELWKNKCVIMSPKVVYGIDVLIPYKEIYAIYSGKTIDGFSMHQQMSRARAAAKVNVLFLNKAEQQVSDTFLTFEQSCQMENMSLANFMADTRKKSKHNPLFALNAVTRGTDGYAINNDSIFGRIHQRASWYKKLFLSNKAFLFKMLCSEQGYVINTIVTEEDNGPTKFVSTKDQLIDEMIRQNERAIKEQTATDKKEQVIADPAPPHPHTDLIAFEQRKEYITTRLKGIRELLSVTNADICTDPRLRGMVADERRFDRGMKSISLYYTKSEIDEREIKEIENNFGHIQKNRRLYRLLKALRFIERATKCDRFKFKNILNYDKSTVKEMVKRLRSGAKILQYISMKKCEKNRILEITNRINKINASDQLAKFCMGLVNQFDKFYSCKSKRKGRSKAIHYDKFRIDNNVINDHIKLINLLRISSTKICKDMQDKITHDGFDDSID